MQMGGLKLTQQTDRYDKKHNIPTIESRIYGENYATYIGGVQQKLVYTLTTKSSPVLISVT